MFIHPVYHVYLYNLYPSNPIELPSMSLRVAPAMVWLTNDIWILLPSGLYPAMPLMLTSFYSISAGALLHYTALYDTIWPPMGTCRTSSTLQLITPRDIAPTWHRTHMGPTSQWCVTCQHVRHPWWQPESPWGIPSLLPSYGSRGRVAPEWLQLCLEYQVSMDDEFSYVKKSPLFPTKWGVL